MSDDWWATPAGVQSALREEIKIRDARIEELEAKLSRQDDLVQAAVAAALTEAADWHREIIEHDQGGLNYSEAVGIPISNATELRASVEAHEYALKHILALIPDAAQAALDRYVKERSDEVAAAQQGARPIWTAPRDGTRILIAPYGNPTDLQVSWFIEGEDRWANWSWSVEPSHWFPLPVIRKGVE